MADDPKRVVAYVKAEALARVVVSASKAWPAQSRALYVFLRDKAMQLPGVVMAGIISENRSEESARLFGDALVLACGATFASDAACGAGSNDTVKKVYEAALETREAIQDHLDAMHL